jgi:glycosyltransferase involved in cell wall biosynthesis
VANKRILVATTVPITLATILRDQPRRLNASFDVALATSPDPGWRDVAEREGVPVFAVPMHRGISPLRDIASISAMVRAILQHRPEIVHSYTPKAGLVAMAAAWLCRVPVRIHTFTGLIFPTSKGFRRWILVNVDRLICALATHVVPEGKGVQGDLQRFGVTRKPLQVIGHGNIAGVDTEFFSRSASGVQESSASLRARLGIGDEEFAFCFVGRLHPDKGIRELIGAFLDQPDRSRLLLVGDLDETVPFPESVLSVIQQHPRVHWLGFQSDIRPALAASDLLVLPSYREGFPNAVLQAGAMALPVIATDVSGSNEVIEPGWNGWLVPPRNQGELARSMIGVARLDRLEARRMGDRARERIRERFERCAHWERMIQFYEDLLSA